MKEFSNHEIVTIAVFLLGGDTANVDTEDAAVKANEIAPGRFVWRKYKDQINIDTVRKRLWDATKKEKGGFLVGSEKNGWLLTAEGVRFAQAKVAKVKAPLPTKNRFNFRETQWIRRERSRMLESEVLAKVQTHGIDSITNQEAEAFFRIDDYVVGDLRRRRLLKILNALGDDPKLGESLKALATRVRGGADGRKQ
jgi:hypothetical protein